MARQKPKSPSGLSWWNVLNSPLAIALVTGVTGLVIGGVATIHHQQQEAAKDRAVRRSEFANLLVEYRQRLSALEEADGELELPEFKEGMSTAGQHKLTDAERKVFEVKSEAVGKREWDIIRGSGSYVPAMPAYANVNLQAIGAQIDDTAGIPQVQSGALQLLGLLNVESSVLWLFVHASLPQMRTYYVGRQMMLINGQLPLDRGDTLTARQERVLGFPEVKPGELERRMKESNALHERVQRKLGDAAEK